jgi:hypothetical protein
MVALTFDSNMTDAMLAELDRHQVASFDNRAVIDELVAARVPATFFLAGEWMERYSQEKVVDGRFSRKVCSAMIMRPAVGRYDRFRQ